MDIAMATNPLLVQSFLGTASSVVAQLPFQSQTVMLPQIGELATAIGQPDQPVTHETELRAKALLEKIVAVPESSRFYQQLQRFMDAWGVTASKPETPRPVRPADPADSRPSYPRGTRYAAVDRHSIVNE